MVKKADTAIALRMDPGELLNKAIESNAGIETLERLLDLAKDVRRETARAAWHESMVAFQADVPDITKDRIAKVRTRSGGEYSYKYAPLDHIMSVIKPVLSKHSFSVTFSTSVGGNIVMAACRVAHSLGHVEVCEFSVPVDTGSSMNVAQQVASALTYARRYALVSALGLAPEDDDDGASVGASNGSMPTWDERPATAPLTPTVTQPQAPQDGPEVALTPSFGATPDELFTEMAEKNLRYYYVTLRDSILDPSKLRYLDINKARFRGVLQALKDAQLNSSLSAIEADLKGGDEQLRLRAETLYPLFRWECERRNPAASDPNTLFDEASGDLE
jgi:hypothetical protein